MPRGPTEQQPLQPASRSAANRYTGWTTVCVTLLRAHRGRGFPLPTVPEDHAVHEADVPDILRSIAEGNTRARGYLDVVRTEPRPGVPPPGAVEG